MSAGRGAAPAGTPLPQKLGIRPGSRLGLVRAPAGFEERLGSLPDGVVVRRRLQGRCDLIVAFCTRRREVEQGLPGWRRSLDAAGGLWLAWPKRAAAVTTDLSDGVVRELGLAAGLVDNKVCALDAQWSALRFVYRRADRAAAGRAGAAST